MMAAKIQSKKQFAGRWRVISMEQWGPDFVNGGQIEVEFDGNGHGLIRFGCVYGKINWWATTRHGEPAMEWCWEDQSEMIVGQSLGWAVLKGGELHGVILLSEGDANFVAEKSTLRPPRKKPR